MNETLKLLSQHRIVPAVVIDDLDQVRPLADAMVAGGLPVIEVTLRTPVAMDAIRMLVQRQDILVGAGTVMSLKQFEDVRRLGAQFIVTPGLDEAVIRHANYRDLPVIPGAVTPTEIMQAQNLGVKLVKFFPSHAFGGLPTIDALSGPFPDMKFLPTGGISLENLPTFLQHPSIFGCGGTWMARREWLQTGQWQRVREACADTATVVKAL